MGCLLSLPTTLAEIVASIADRGLLHSLSYAVSYLYLVITRRSLGRRFDLYDFRDDVPEKHGFFIPEIEWKTDVPQSSSLQKNADDVFCFGTNAASEFLSVQISRKPNGLVRCSLFLVTNGKTYTLPEEHSLQQAIDEPYVFGTSRLKMECLEPMRKWRLFFNGTLKETSRNEENVSYQYRHVKFAFIWTASSEVFDFSTDMSKYLLAETAASNKSWSWTPSLLVQRLQNIFNAYDQPGMILGTVTVEGESEREIYLWGIRSHFMGKTSDLSDCNFQQLYAKFENGSLIHLGILKIPGLISKFVYGYVMRANGFIYPIDKCDLDKVDTKWKSKQVINCCSGLWKYLIKIEMENDEFTFQKGFDGESFVKTAKVSLCGMEGTGLVFNGIVKEPLNNQLKNNFSFAIPHLSLMHAPLSLPFQDTCCQLVEVSGGKGASLAKLYSISEETKKSFVVPKGIVVTTAAYKEFTSGKLKTSLSRFEKNIWNQSREDTGALLHGQIIQEVRQAELPKSVIKSVERDLRNVFGDKLGELRFAVRSSATGEDSEQMSAAGQMDTYLGLKGLDEILNAVKKCWASQFSFIAVEYKRRYGQVLNTPMAVVIQEMVACDMAGVAFTCDPLTGNPAFISVTANYGLGESVVSAQAEPDTVTLARGMDNKVSFHSQEIGSKKTKIVMDGLSGTKEVEIDNDQASECCLSKELALKLGDIAIKIEERFGGPRDIEWGIAGDKIFLFQGRPVTSLDIETDFETKHYFDTYMRREDEVVSKANVGEVMPGASSPLGLDFLWKMFEIAYPRPFVRMDGEPLPDVPYFLKRLPYYYNHVFFNVSDAFLRFSDQDEAGKEHTKGIMVAVFGRAIDDDKISEIAIDRHSDVNHQNKMTLLGKMYIFMLMFTAGYLSRKKGRKLEKFRIPVEKTHSAENILNIIGEQWTPISEALECHIFASFMSSFWNLSMLALIAKEQGEWNNDVYSDFANLLATCTQVESADVPAAIQNLGSAISHSIEPKQFKAMSIEEALEWLRSSPSSAGIKFRDFITKHGHRCLREMDLYSKTWGQEPKPLVKILQNFVGADMKDSEVKKTSTFDDLMSNMKVKLGFLSRLKVRFILPNCRRCVRDRETSKSIVINVFDCIREPFHRLAEVMVEEGRIPNREFLFFLNIEEIRQLIKTRSPKLVSRAFRRKKCYAELDKLIFPEIITGIPRPINTDEDFTTTGDGFTMTGLPVSQGVAKATARVVMSLDEASTIQTGDILIAYSTDIGWSPYFPLLSGVVTELGGLISHGAVVAREYGLPCVVGLHGATRAFKSGDLVLLDGNKGILKRLESSSS